MEDNTPEEIAAGRHHHIYGAQFARQESRYIPTQDERGRFAPIEAPMSGPWSYAVLDSSQTTALLNGYRARGMDEKWNIYSDDVSDDGSTVVHFVRSWTGRTVFSVSLQLLDTGSRVMHATWETSPNHLKQPTEEFARETFEGCCQYILRTTRPTRPPD